MKSRPWKLFLALLISVYLSTAARAQQALEDPGKVSTLARVEAMLALYKIPGVSIAVFDQGRILWAEGLGVLQQGGSRPVTATSRFQAASISKPVAAFAALCMVAAGELELDEDVNEFLLSWEVPDHEFSEAVTLRRLLCHGAGTTVHGFPGYDSRTDAAHLLDILSGQEPANTPAIFVDLKPGSAFRYSGGGYCILQQMMVDVRDQDFPAILDALVLQPLEMTHSSYTQPLPAALHAEAAHGHRDQFSATPGRWHVYPEMAAAGLWTTSADLARFALGLCRSWRGAKDATLPQPLARQMLEAQVEAHAGLGMFLNRGGTFFEHSGANDGFRCRLFCLRDSMSGAAIMTNSDHGSVLIREAIKVLFEVYDWPQDAMR